jgi:hypothetical protein
MNTNEIPSIVKDDIATIMRQTECYDINLIKEKYINNNKDVLETIFDIMNMKIIDDKPKTDFEKMREIVDEKEKLFHEKSSKKK